MPQVSKTLLYQLRNDIPIAFFVQNILKLPCKFSEGFLRFLCPKCKEFRTATNKKTNLARCFLCEENFNPIDLTIIVYKVRFLDAVNMLKPLLVEIKSS